MTLNLRARLARSRGRRFLFEWCAVACLGAAVVMFAASGSFTSGVDHLVYDQFLSFRPIPVSPDIVIVEIDNASISQLGRWPWPRSVHARLLDQLAKAHPAAVVYDVLFTEPAQDDAQLAHAIGAQPTFLPLLLGAEGSDGKRTVDRPVAPIADAAASLGHINLEVDNDGIVRSVAMFESDSNRRWQQLMVPVYRAAREGKITLANGSERVRRHPDQTTRAENSEGRFLIPFSLRSETYSEVSFASVLSGNVPADMLRNRIVLIGVTASGLYDRFSTPVSGELGPMPGVYIHANVLDTLFNGRAILPARTWLLASVSLCALAVLLGGFLLMSPRHALMLMLALCAAMICGSLAILYAGRLWLTPVPAILGLLVAYPIWNWRRLEMTMSYVRKQLQDLAGEPHLLPEAPQHADGFFGDVLEQHMALMEQAAQRSRDMKRFVWDSLDSVPAPILVSNLRGVVLIANHAAKTYFAQTGKPAPEGRAMWDALNHLTFVKSVRSQADVDERARAQWPAPLDPTHSDYAEMMKQGIEVRDNEERDHLLHFAECTNAQGAVTGWIAGLVDVTALHAAERQREDALRLLSHDMRSPQASILALVEMERARLESDRARELLDRVERYAQRTLTLADDFVQLARAESQTYELEPQNLIELMIDASDEVWPQAQARSIRLDTELPQDADDASVYWIQADRSLMTRALINIMNNAVKYSPPDTRITCTVFRDIRRPDRVQCAISDQGYGIPIEQQARLFQRFRRFHGAERSDVSGVGLGMAFVKTVITRHGGDVQIESDVGRGTTFTVSLPVSNETVT